MTHRSAKPAFTVVELIVVVAIIALVLAIAIPGFNAMSSQARLTRSRQLLNGIMTRAAVIATADRALTAVRIFPAAWDQSDRPLSQTGFDALQAQTAVLYRYVTGTGEPSDISRVIYGERFERLKGSDPVLLPADTWAAPIEALSTNTNLPNNFDTVLQGDIGRFELNAGPRQYGDRGAPGAQTGEKFLDADDFLVVFDPNRGLVGSTKRLPWRMSAYVPANNPAGLNEGESAGQWRNDRFGRPYVYNPFQRNNFTGLVLYQRDRFVSLGASGDDSSVRQARRALLAASPYKYYVSGAGGALVAER